MKQNRSKIIENVKKILECSENLSEDERMLITDMYHDYIYLVKMAGDY